jgi:hypothetical protein
MEELSYVKTSDKSYPTRCKTLEEDGVTTLCFSLLATAWKWLPNSVTHVTFLFLYDLGSLGIVICLHKTEVRGYAPLDKLREP